MRIWPRMNPPRWSTEFCSWSEGLLKACDFWTDTAQGVFDLRFVRTKEKEEVDFLVLRNSKPWLLVECKSSTTMPQKTLIKFS